jgi:hypothetical protein
MKMLAQGQKAQEKEKGQIMSEQIPLSEFSLFSFYNLFPSAV